MVCSGRGALRLLHWPMEKLVNTKVEGKDTHAHINHLAKYHKRLSALVTLEKPLTPDNVHITVLLSSIPADWIHCVSALMNQEGVKTETIVSALKNEVVCCESHGDIISISSTTATAPKQRASNQRSTQAQPNNRLPPAQTQTHLQP
ncbi:hypothetical protein PSTG_01350 [Puccinia striiformis f. sp. tritici PST-78]|uniref:Uncharacterized protein n=1 Tax=Puccinia striiformis f. sp. tritici PST-78 TaxID=1165861 RepID=A0A0L0W208_9BASI|nr:hypothetical protein PSTG_01350 [Puccinia striiformis f. sp. tritici PST-78]